MRSISNVACCIGLTFAFINVHYESFILHSSIYAINIHFPDQNKNGTLSEKLFVSSPKHIKVWSVPIIKHGKYILVVIDYISICIITYRATLRNKKKLLCNSCIFILYWAYVHCTIKKKIKINILLRLRWIWRKDLGRQKVVQQRVQRDCANFVFWLWFCQSSVFAFPYIWDFKH